MMQMMPKTISTIYIDYILLANKIDTRQLLFHQVFFIVQHMPCTLWPHYWDRQTDRLFNVVLYSLA